DLGADPGPHHDHRHPRRGGGPGQRPGAVAGVRCDRGGRQPRRAAGRPRQPAQRVDARAGEGLMAGPGREPGRGPAGPPRAPAAGLAGPDRGLAERERHVPDCALLLDDAALSAALGRAVRVTRLRYKPGTSAAVAWEAVGGPGPAGVPRQGWAGAFRDPAKAGKALLVAARTGSAAWRLPGSAAAVAGAAASDRAVAGPLARLRKRHPGVLDGAV